eukprot:310437_1
MSTSTSTTRNPDGSWTTTETATKRVPISDSGGDGWKTITTKKHKTVKPKRIVQNYDDDDSKYKPKKKQLLWDKYSNVPHKGDKWTKTKTETETKKVPISNAYGDGTQTIKTTKNYYQTEPRQRTFNDPWDDSGRYQPNKSKGRKDRSNKHSCDDDGDDAVQRRRDAERRKRNAEIKKQEREDRLR